MKSVELMLMAKCCHDAIYGLVNEPYLNLNMFQVLALTFSLMKLKKPEGAGTRCMVDCAIEEDAYTLLKSSILTTTIDGHSMLG